MKRPGVSLEYRAGYYAPRDFAHSKHEDREQQLMDALRGGAARRPTCTSTCGGVLRQSDTRFYVPVSVVVPGSDVPFSRAASEDRATLDVLGVVWTKRAGRSGASATRVKLRTRGRVGGSPRRFSYQTAFELPPGT